MRIMNYLVKFIILLEKNNILGSECIIDLRTINLILIILFNVILFLFVI